MVNTHTHTPSTVLTSHRPHEAEAPVNVALDPICSQTPCRRGGDSSAGPALPLTLISLQRQKSFPSPVCPGPVPRPVLLRWCWPEMLLCCLPLFTFLALGKRAIWWRSRQPWVLEHRERTFPFLSECSPPERRTGAESQQRAAPSMCFAVGSPSRV